MNNKKNSAVTDVERRDVDIWMFYKYLSIITIITVLLFFISFLVLIMGYFDVIITFFEYFEGAEPINRFIMAELTNKFNLTCVTTIFIILFAYFSFFEYIKKKRIATSEEEAREGKYFNFIQSFYAIFNFVILFPFIFYLVCIKFAMFEALTVTLSYIFGKIIFSRLIKSHKKIIFNYSLLSAFEISSVLSDLRDMVKKARYDLKNFFIKIKNVDFSRNIEKYQQYVKSLQKGVIWYISIKNPLILKSIFVLTFITAFFGLIFEFNLLSIIYLELNLVVWYFIVSAVSYLPKKTANITLNTGEIIEDVYILEDSPKGYILALTHENKIMKIMTGSVVIIR